MTWAAVLRHVDIGSGSAGRKGAMGSIVSEGSSANAHWSVVLSSHRDPDPASLAIPCPICHFPSAFAPVSAALRLSFGRVRGGGGAVAHWPIGGGTSIWNSEALWVDPAEGPDGCRDGIMAAPSTARQNAESV